MSAVFILCGILGFLQYRWIGEVGMAERDRLGKTLQATLDRLSQDFDADAPGRLLAFFGRAGWP